MTGWESQLLETGFLGAFLCPLWSLRRVPRDTPTSMVVIWGFRWLIIRIMFGAVRKLPIVWILYWTKFDHDLSQMTVQKGLTNFIYKASNMWASGRRLPQVSGFRQNNVENNVNYCICQGLIKIRGDQCWRDLTCMNYHYEVCSFISMLNYNCVTSVIYSMFCYSMWLL